MPQPIPVLVDCDPGHDDALALLLAHASPAIDLLAITTVAGNQTLDMTTQNARLLAGAVGIGVPIAAGCDRPMLRRLETAAAVHGQTGMDGHVFLNPPAPLDPRHGVDVIVETALEVDGLAIVAIGPLTNIAVALRLRPAIATRIRQISLMAGAWGLGNHTPAAEFNAYVDPEAAKVVLESGIPIRMAGVELTRQAAITDTIMQRIAGVSTVASAIAVDLLTFYRQRFQLRHGYDAAPVYDPCAVAWLIDETLISGRRMHVSVETSSEDTRGRTICDVEGVLGLSPNALVGMDLDTPRFWDLLMDALSSYAPIETAVSVSSSSGDSSVAQLA